MKICLLMKYQTSCVLNIIQYKSKSHEQESNLINLQAVNRPSFFCTLFVYIESIMQSNKKPYNVAMNKAKLIFDIMWLYDLNEREAINMIKQIGEKYVSEQVERDKQYV